MIKATYVNHMGDDLTVVNSARVSFGKKRDALGYSQIEGQARIPVLHDRDIGLINYLATHKHTSPFGHCFASYHIKAPVFVARQLVKHKFLRWNEISRRYVDYEPEFYSPTDWRARSEDKKQGSGDTIDVDLQRDIGFYNKESSEYYEHLLQEGVAPEMARMVLPQSMYTEWYWSGSLDAFADMCRLRCASDTQVETRQVANQISKEMNQLFPISWKALTEEVIV